MSAEVRYAAAALAVAACRTPSPVRDDAAHDAVAEAAPEIVDAAAGVWGGSAERTRSAEPQHGDVLDAAPDVAVDAAPARVFSGEATWYATDGRGACRFPPNPDDPNVVAINKVQWPKIACGQCLLVTGPNGSVKVRVVDVCPGCSRGDLDLSAQAFAAIAAPELGRVRVRWYVVAC